MTCQRRHRATASLRAVIARPPEPLPLVFDEPINASDGPFNGYADWLRTSGTAEAQAAREDINAWYAAFPDRDRMVLSRLQGDDEIGILQALDELYVHHLLSASPYEARYEEDATSPDFRLYRSSEYVAGIEVLTLFAEESFTSRASRNATLVDEINERVSSAHWYVILDVVEWNRQPRYTEIAKWLNGVVATLGEPPPGLARANYPTARYTGAEVKLEVEFIPRSVPDPASKQIVGFGPAIARMVQPARRLRRNLSHKIGSRYDHRERPYAVLVSARDYACAVEDVFDALHGDRALSFQPGQPGSAQPIRMNNGTFGLSPSSPEGRNRRLGCVFALMRGWAPGNTVAPTIVRFDNPFAQQAFPEDALAPVSWFSPVQNGSGVRMQWR
jgi:hypothetical protein